MKTFIRQLVFVALLLLATAGQAQDLLQKMSRQRPNRLVNDYTGTLRGSQRDVLEAQLVDLDRRTGAQIAVVVLATLDGGEVEDFANRLYEAWGIGKKGEDKGVLFLVALQDRKLRIEVGYGLEGVLPDGKCGQIRDQYVLPLFKMGRNAEGIVAGATALAQVVAKDAGVPFGSGQGQRVTYRRDSKGSPLVTFIILLIMIPIIIRNPWLLLFLMSSGRGGFHGGGFGGGGGGGFGGFGGGMSGGGGASGSW